MTTEINRYCKLHNLMKKMTKEEKKQFEIDILSYIFYNSTYLTIYELKDLEKVINSIKIREKKSREQ